MESLYVIIGIIVGLVLKPYLSSYSGEKGKNLATREDIDHITRTVESIKSQFSNDLEFLKLQLTKKANVIKSLNAPTRDN